MVEACIEVATAEGWRMHIVVMDNGSNLVAYQKMTDAQNVSRDIAMGKARASSGINAATRQLAGFAFGENGPGAMAFVPGLNFFPGGLPIRSGDVHIGGIGVSGASGDQDEQCAQSGLDAAAAAGLL